MPAKKATIAPVLTVELSAVKDTKGFRVFGEDVEDAAIPSLYVRKSASEGFGDKITVYVVKS